MPEGMRTRLRRMSSDVESVRPEKLAALDQQRLHALNAVQRAQYDEADRMLVQLQASAAAARMRVARERKAASQVWLSCIVRARSWRVRGKPDLARDEPASTASDTPAYPQYRPHVTGP